MSLPSRAALTVLLALFCSGAVVAVFVGAGTAVAQTDDAVQLDMNTSTVIELEADGDARITVQTTFDLESDADSEAYRTLESEFLSEETAMLGLDAFERAAEHVNGRTDREMEIQNVTQSTASDALVANGTGRLAVSFTWTNFARPDGDLLHIDDALRTETGIWYDGLNENQTLVMRPPSGFGVSTANVDEEYVAIGEGGTIRWTGPATFDEESLAVTFVGNSGTVTDTPSPTPDNAGGTNDTILWLLVIVVVGITGLFFAYVLHDRDQITLPTGGDDSAGETTSDETDNTEPAEPDQPDETAEELLSDEERVVQLIEANGGRMKQADIVKETDWSNAKVSQLLSAMEEEGEIDKLRIGRENLISFPDEDITDLDDG
ncbi:helix-turn-helix transcriptional regulator [Halovenus marina]|uniref:helix-turn-helix transcriptional regulator n=1 Tax=Halovenus marina TaxID=3396621 RepID=UPI003F56B755